MTDPYVVEDGAGSLVGHPFSREAADGLITITITFPTLTTRVDPADLPVRAASTTSSTASSMRWAAGETFSNLSAENKISLIEPTVLEFSRITWRFRFSHVWEGEAFQTGSYTIETHGYSIEDSFSLPLAPWNLRYITPAQQTAGWQATSSEDEPERLEFYASLVTVDTEHRWRIVMDGNGRARLIVDDGDIESPVFRVRANVWYSLRMDMGAGATEYSLSDEDGIVATLDGAVVVSAPLESFLGASGLRYGDETLRVDIADIALHGGAFAGQDKVYFIGGAQYGPSFDGVLATFPDTFGWDNGWVTAIRSDGTRTTWDPNPEGWSEVRAISADATGVYVYLFGGIGAWSDVASRHLRDGIYKFDHDGEFLWRWLREDFESWGVPVRDGHLVAVSGGTLVMLDTETGELEWEFELPDTAMDWNVGPDGTAWVSCFDDNIYRVGSGGIQATRAFPAPLSTFFMMPCDDPDIFYADQRLTGASHETGTWGIYRLDLSADPATATFIVETVAEIPAFAPWWPFFTVDPVTREIFGAGGFIAHGHEDPEDNFDTRWQRAWLDDGTLKWAVNPFIEQDYHLNHDMAVDGVVMVLGIYDEGGGADLFSPAMRVLSQADGSTILSQEWGTEATDGWNVYAGAIAPSRAAIAAGDDVEDEDGPVSPGWNTEHVLVADGRFSLKATPTPGSLDVYSYATGLLIDYPDDYVEADEGGLEYTILTDDEYVIAVYHVPDPALGQHIPVARPQEQIDEQNRPRGPITGMG